MFVIKIEWNKYSVPFVKPFETAHGQMFLREGIILKISASFSPIHSIPEFNSNFQLTYGLGEIAPLSDFGEGGTITVAQALLEKVIPKLVGTSIEELLSGYLDDVIDSVGLELRLQTDLRVTGQVQSTVRFGIELALYDILAQVQKQPLAVYWGAILAPVEVNATVGVPDISDAVATSVRMVQAGYKCIKLKVGMAESDELEVARVAAVRQAIDNCIGFDNSSGNETYNSNTNSVSRIKLRLDANEGWTISRAIRLLKQLAQYDLELVEQPVQAKDIAGLAQVQLESGVTLAADEAVTGMEAAKQIIANKAAKVLVIKPSMVGGIAVARKIIRLAEEADMRCIVTTSLDTGVGIAAAYHLALTLKQPRLACGLATAQLLESTLVSTPLQVQFGAMLPVNAVGLGVRLSKAATDRYFL